ncbi:hypothetical protein T492DRAFT_910617 [Pavlovales sp. CCMP2436]|nr:hypothetical protein T492DRAFT_910617 [Pavlovales sp. CCMP2436]
MAFRDKVEASGSCWSPRYRPRTPTSPERMFDVTGLSRLGHSRFMHGGELPALTALRDRPPSPAESPGRYFTECGSGSKSLMAKLISSSSIAAEQVGHERLAVKITSSLVKITGMEKILADKKATPRACAKPATKLAAVRPTAVPVASAEPATKHATELLAEPSSVLAGESAASESAAESAVKPTLRALTRRYHVGIERRPWAPLDIRTAPPHVM